MATICNELRTSDWLAKRLNISSTTVERLRAIGGNALPPHVLVGRQCRYDEDVVERWLKDRLINSPAVSKVEGEPS